MGARTHLVGHRLSIEGVGYSSPTLPTPKAISLNLYLCVDDRRCPGTQEGISQVGITTSITNSTTASASGRRQSSPLSVTPWSHAGLHVAPASVDVDPRQARSSQRGSAHALDGRCSPLAVLGYRELRWGWQPHSESRSVAHVTAVGGRASRFLSSTLSISEERKILVPQRLYYQKDGIFECRVLSPTFKKLPLPIATQVSC